MIAIHNSGKWSFRPEWEEYCKQNQIPYRLVNAYDSNIINQVKECEAFLFHHHHTDPRDYNFAKQLLFSLEQSGLKVFPNFNTGWHFDDKLGQKYLLESLNAPLVPTHVFYNKSEALEFAKTTTYPKVFKLRGGAGSNNVSLIRNQKEAKRHIEKSFGNGFENYNRWGDLKEILRRFELGSATVKEVLKSFRRLIVSTEFSKTAGREKGYFLIQDFLPNNTFDIRVITIGKRAFAIKRPVRKDDFRASGSGMILYDKNEIDERCLNIAFDITARMQAQSVAYDFVFDQDHNPLIVEVNYGFAHRAYDLCPGWWDSSLEFHPGEINPCGWIIEEILTIRQ